MTFVQKFRRVWVNGNGAIVVTVILTKRQAYPHELEKPSGSIQACSPQNNAVENYHEEGYHLHPSPVHVYSC